MPAPAETRRGVVTGWRCWTVLKADGLLRPIWRRNIAWKPRQPIEAVCAAEEPGTGPTTKRPSLHRVPHASCKCGIWAVCHPKLLTEVEWAWNDDETLIVGQVALWGHVIEHARGWRSQFAYPTSLYAFTDDQAFAGLLRDRYGVPVAWGAEADALSTILPASLRRPGAAAAPVAVPDVMPQLAPVPPVMLGVLDMMRGQETARLAEQEREIAMLRDALEVSRHQVKAVRAAVALEKQRLKQEHRLLTLETERHAVALERLQREAVRRAATQDQHNQRLVARAQGRVTRAAPKVPYPEVDIADLKRRLVAHGIRQVDVATAARISITGVCRVLGGHAKSRNVIASAERLLEDAATKKNKKGAK